MSTKYSERLAEAGIEPSVGSVGDSCHNVLATATNGLYQAEAIHPGRPRRSLKAVEFATLEWAAGFNNHRLLEPIGYVPPVEVTYYAALDHEPMAA